MYLYVYKDTYSRDYLKKTSIEINVATDEGNSPDEIGH